MLYYLRPLICGALLAAVSGCASSITTSASGRTITAKTAFPNHVEEGGSSPDEAAINIAGGFFLVSTERIQWSRNDQVNSPSAWHKITLPPAWKNVRLEQADDCVLVFVDNQRLVKVRPAE
jgi:hypothetical protein